MKVAPRKIVGEVGIIATELQFASLWKIKKILMNQLLASQIESSAAARASYPVTDRVQEALAVSLRGCEELIPQDEWIRKLARS